MAGERRINFGADATDARYRIEDTGDGANFVVAEDLDGGTVLLEYDDSRTPSEWVVRGPVDLDGNDLSAGAIDATSVSTVEQHITGAFDRPFDWAIFRRGDTYYASSGADISPEYEDASLSSLWSTLQSEIDARSKIQFGTRNKGPNTDAGTLVVDGTLTVSDSLAFVGAENGNTLLKLGDGVNGPMFELNNGGTAVAIVKFIGLRMEGNKANNTSGVGILNRDFKEMVVRNCEIRSFENYGVHYNARVSMMHYNTLENCWMLGQESDVRLDDDGGEIDEFAINDGYYKSQFTVEVMDGAVNNLKITGASLHGTVLPRGGSGLTINDCVLRDRGQEGVDIIPSTTPHDFNAQIKDNYIEGDGRNIGIRIRDGADNIWVKNNLTVGTFSNQDILNNSTEGNVIIEENRQF